MHQNNPSKVINTIAFLVVCHALSLTLQSDIFLHIVWILRKFATGLVQNLVSGLDSSTAWTVDWVLNWCDLDVFMYHLVKELLCIYHRRCFSFLITSKFICKNFVSWSLYLQSKVLHAWCNFQHKVSSVALHSVLTVWNAHISCKICARQMLQATPKNELNGS